jgi:hypothetical protein
MDLVKWVRKIEKAEPVSGFKQEIKPIKIFCPRTKSLIATELVERIGPSKYRKTIKTSKGDYKCIETFERINVTLQDGKAVSVYQKLD